MGDSAEVANREVLTLGKWADVLGIKVQQVVNALGHLRLGTAGVEEMKLWAQAVDQGSGAWQKIIANRERVKVELPRTQAIEQHGLEVSEHFLSRQMEMYDHRNRLIEQGIEAQNRHTAAIEAFGSAVGLTEKVGQALAASGGAGIGRATVKGIDVTGPAQQLAGLMKSGAAAMSQETGISISNIMRLVEAGALRGSDLLAAYQRKLAQQEEQRREAIEEEHFQKQIQREDERFALEEKHYAERFKLEQSTLAVQQQLAAVITTEASVQKKWAEYVATAEAEFKKIQEIFSHIVDEHPQLINMITKFADAMEAAADAAEIILNAISQLASIPIVRTIFGAATSLEHIPGAIQMGGTVSRGVVREAVSLGSGGGGAGQTDAILQKMLDSQKGQEAHVKDLLGALERVFSH